MREDAYQILSDCPHCKVQAAVVQIMDPLHPACHLGVPQEQRCRMCLWTVTATLEPFSPRLPMAAGRCPNCQHPLSEQARTGASPCDHCGYQPTVELTQVPQAMSDEAVVRELLARWAAEENESGAEAFCQANLGRSADDAVAALLRGETVETTFDVIAFLFPGSGSGGGTVDPKDLDQQRRIAVIDRPPEALSPLSLEDIENELPTEDKPRRVDTLTASRALISVMVADGELRIGERRFIDQWLTREGLPAMAVDDVRVWRPQELGVPPDRKGAEKILEAMIHLAHLDRERDGSEWKVIQSYAAAWAVPEAVIVKFDKRYDQKYSTAMTLLWRTLSRLVRIH